jgi:hypothetical protein
VNEPNVVSNDALFIAVEAMMPGARNAAYGAPPISETKCPTPYPMARSVKSGSPRATTKNDPA